MKINTRGFTLIELLVVIAIIGILSSVVLVSLNSARSKGSAVALLSSINSLKAGIAICNGNGATLGTTKGSALCAGETAVLPTATQLRVTDAVFTASGPTGNQMYTIVVTGNSAIACNVTWAIDEASTTIANAPANTVCK